jgi:succinate dehydrogenase/fumarate reductase flavoprotein subunit
MDWEKIKFGLLSAAGGAIVVAVIGFNWGGWVTTDSAEAMAKEIAANAVAERLGSICVAQFNKDSQRIQKLNEMKGQDTWEIGRYIDKQSWRSCRVMRNPIAGLPMRAPIILRNRSHRTPGSDSLQIAH